MIRRAYLEAVRLLHPDLRSGEGSPEMTRLNVARDTLLDPIKRQRYDQQLGALPLSERLAQAREDADRWMANAVDAVDAGETVLGAAKSTIEAGRAAFAKLRRLWPSKKPKP